MALDAAIEMNPQTDEKPIRHWSRIEERGVFLGLKIMLKTYRIFGRPGFSLILYPVILYFYLTNRAARRASAAYLQRIDADTRGRRGLGRWPARLRSLRHFLSFGAAILDKLRAWTGGLQLSDVDFENFEAYTALQEAGRGGLIIVSHLGNAEVSRALETRFREGKITFLVHTRHAEKFNRLMHEESPRSAVSLIQTTEIGPDTAIFLKQKIDAGEMVVIAGDRTPASGSSRVSSAPFLGKSAPFPEGPFILAAVLKCPVLLLFCLKEKSRFRIIFEPFSDVVDMPRARRREILSDLTRRYAERLEFHCLTTPYQWFNFYDFWRGAAPANRNDEHPE